MKVRISVERRRRGGGGEGERRRKERGMGEGEREEKEGGDLEGLVNLQRFSHSRQKSTLNIRILILCWCHVDK